MKVWLDDEPHVEWRASLYPKAEWFNVRWPEDMIGLLIGGTVTHIGLDHDLADKDAALAEGRKERTGYDVVEWIEYQVKVNQMVPPEITVHSQNGPGRDRILAAVRQIQKYHEENLTHPT